MEFRLIVEASGAGSEPSLCLEGRYWKLSQMLDLDGDSPLLGFACISYVWGSRREQNPLVEGQISARACPALAAAIRLGHCKAFWTDIFCIPSIEPQRQATLESMGYIYSRACEVIIVLGGDTFSLIQRMMHDGFVSEPDLQLLELDEWISSVWTYQEVIHGQNVHFVSEEQVDGSESIDCMELLCALGWSLEKLKKATDVDNGTMIQRFPNLSAMENTLADWQRGAYVYRSALSVFTNMASKRNSDTASYFYAAIGTLTENPKHLQWSVSHTPAEQLMAICELKNDYSFIFTVAARSDDPLRAWCPRACSTPVASEQVPAFLRPMLKWHCWGEAQYGHYDREGLWLHDMIVMMATPTFDASGRAALAQIFAPSPVDHQDDHAIAKAVHVALCARGFIGHPMPMFVSEGLIFVMTAVAVHEVQRILVSTQVRWPQGSPGIVELVRDHTHVYVPCVFVGNTKILAAEGTTVHLGPFYEYMYSPLAPAQQ